MEPRPINDADRVYWAALHPREFQFSGPHEVEHGIEPCPALVTDDDVEGNKFGRAVRVPWTMSTDEIAQLAAGGTLWLTTFGILPIHSLHVQAVG